MRTEKMNGIDVVRFDDDKTLDESWSDAEKAAGEGKAICLTDLMIKAERPIVEKNRKEMMRNGDMPGM